MAPMTWLRAVLGLRMRPAAHTASMRRTRISPVATSTPTSTKCAPKVDCWNFFCRSPYSMLSSTTSSPSAAASARGTERSPARTMPSANWAASGGMPSFCAMASRSFTQAAYTPAVEELPPHCPPEPADTGNAESPSRTMTLPTGTPSISAAVCAMMVYEPVPMSVMSVSTVTTPRWLSRTRAPDFIARLLRNAAATPRPTSQRPSRTWPGSARRWLQPKRWAPVRRHSMSWRCEKGRSGFSGSTWVSLMTRNSTGSMPSLVAISSMAISSAIMPGASPGARMALPSGRSSTARRVAVMRWAPA